jgi:hypothetical protein
MSEPLERRVLVPHYQPWTPSYRFIEIHSDDARHRYAVGEIRWKYAPGIGLMVSSVRGNVFGVPENEPDAVRPALMVRQFNKFGAIFEGKMIEGDIMVLEGVKRICHIYSARQSQGERRKINISYNVFPVREVR